MPVLRLPTEPRELSVSLVKRRSAQESAFTGAVQHVLSPGYVWRGYMELPAIVDYETWAETRNILQRVLERDEDRLAVPIVEGHWDYGFPDTRFRAGQVSFAGRIHREGEYLGFYVPEFPSGLVLPTAGIWGTLIWHDGTETVLRAGLSQLTRISDRVDLHSSTERNNAGVPDEGLFQSVAVTAGNNLYAGGDYPTLELHRIPDGFFFRLSPPLPQMFRADLGAETDRWLPVQVQLPRPFVPAVILNDDALGHTIADRAIIPNRIEFVSSSVWPS